ncbi:MAG: hypothetical protein K9W44_13590 [Candidatus Lokiarchaeota archaeon]|nr:hypothetical protein [Candidatus Harpocratesius repetitus]
MENEFFLGSLVFVTGFFFLLFMRVEAKIIYLFPIFSYTIACFFYNLQDHFSQSYLKTPIFSYNPLGNLLLYARLNLIAAILQEIIVLIWINDFLAHNLNGELSNLHILFEMYGFYYLVLETLLFSLGIIATLLFSVSGQEIRIFNPLDNELFEKRNQLKIENINLKSKIHPKLSIFIRNKSINLIIFALFGSILAVYFTYFLHTVIIVSKNIETPKFTFEMTLIILNNNEPLKISVSFIIIFLIIINILALIIYFLVALMQIKKIDLSTIENTLIQNNIQNRMVIMQILHEIFEKT